MHQDDADDIKGELSEIREKLNRVEGSMLTFGKLFGWIGGMFLFWLFMDWLEKPLGIPWPFSFFIGIGILTVGAVVYIGNS